MSPREQFRENQMRFSDRLASQPIEQATLLAHLYPDENGQGWFWSVGPREVKGVAFGDTLWPIVCPAHGYCFTHWGARLAVWRAKRRLPRLARQNRHAETWEL